MRTRVNLRKCLPILPPCRSSVPSSCGLDGTVSTAALSSPLDSQPMPSLPDASPSLPLLLLLLAQSLLWHLPTIRSQESTILTPSTTVPSAASCPSLPAVPP